MTAGLNAEVVDRIRRNGPMPFAAFMQLALYHPRHGYYSSRPRTGFSGHFVTSPEIDPAFGTLWGNGFEQMWEACGRPDGFEVVEVGPGEGGFAASVLASVRGAFADALTYTLVERAPEARRRQGERLRDADRVRWVSSLQEATPITAGCIFANEVLDNLPVHIVERRDGELRELCVDADGDRLVLRSLPLSSPEVEGWLTRTGLTVAEGHRAEVGLAAESFVRRAATLLRRGALVLVDYGMNSDELAGRPGGTLVSYSSSGADDDVIARPGERDITAHVNWSGVAAACRAAGLEVVGPVAQADVLRELGLGHMHEALASEHRAALDRGNGAAAVRALSSRQALGALADRGGLGGLDVVVGLKGLPPSSVPWVAI